MTKHLTRAYEQMQADKNIEKINASLDAHFKELACELWMNEKRDEYYEKYPLFREPTDEEKEEQYNYCLDALEDGETVRSKEDFKYTQIPIKYEYCEECFDADEENEAYCLPKGCIKTFQQWINDETCPKYDTENDIKNFKNTDENFKAYEKRSAEKALESLEVEIKEIPFQADTRSLVYMNAIGTVASKHFNKALAGGMKPNKAYKAIYQDILIDWKDANNNVVPVTVESILEALEASIKEVATVIGV